MNEINEPASQVHRSDSLISSVGFHTLSKQTSASSSLSSQTSRSTLNRILHRERSQSSSQEKTSARRRSIDKRGGDGLPSQSFKSHFFSSRGFLRSRSTQPNTLQTEKDSASVHSKWTSSDKSKFRKSIDSRESLSLSTMPKSQSHRPSLSSSTEGEPNLDIRNVPAKGGKHTGVSFSSQKSNSVLTDARMASLFYFSQSYLYEEGVTPNVDSSRFQEIQRKYLASADQYMQNRLQKMSLDEDSSRPGTLDETRVMGATSQISKRYEAAFTKLFEMIKPILLPSKQIILVNGQAHPLMDYSLDRVMRFVEEEIIYPNEAKASKSHETLQLKPPQTTSVNSKRADGVLEVEMFEELLDELLKKINAFFSKCLALLASDLNVLDESLIKQLKILAHEDSPIIISQRYLAQWNYIERAWLYFSTKVRFFFLNSFFYLQKYLYQLLDRHSKFKERRALFDLNAVLVRNFKAIFIIPQLKQRYRELEKQRRGPFQATSFEFTQGEIMFLQKDNCLQGKAIARIFGSIAMQSRTDLTSLEEMSLNDSLFCEFHLWLKDLTR